VLFDFDGTESNGRKETKDVDLRQEREQMGGEMQRE